ncbi:MAG: UvrD-helicase domain-containing protein, partial [Bacillota bacterium]|nr:UvrD-helicase domain-containing protein [Bacillota bacterium]
MKDANQGLAVNFEHADIIVAAGAGTGKTESMTNRVVRKVTEGMSIRNILVLTFTNAAAAEMKGRIEAKLRDAAYAEKNPDEKLRLLSETQLVDRAHIQTFHSFCVDIIREYHHFIELSPDFRVLSESERKLLLDEAFDRVFQKAAYLCPLAYEWYAQIDRAGKPRQFKELTLKLLELAENAVDFEVALRDFNAYRADKLEILIQINEELIPDLEKQAEREIAVFERFVEDSPIAGNSGIRTQGDLLVIPDKNGKWKEIKSPRRVASETLEKIRDRFDAVKKGGDAPYRRTPLKSVPEEVYLGQEIFGIPVDAQEDYKIIADRVHDSVKKAIADLQERKSFAQGGVIPHRELFERYFEDLAHFVLLVRKSFVESKAERNVIDFGDQEHKAFELLEKEAVRDSVRSRFEAVFVDENQDSSEIQDRIVHHAVGGTLYRVGDVKQCIYAFRSAEPKIFQHYVEHDAVLYDAYASELPSERELAEARRVVIPLNTNFRTVQPILDFVNLIFRHEMASLYKGAELISFRTIETTAPNGDATATNANAEENSAVRNPVRVLRYEGKEALALKRESHSPDDSLGDDADGHESGPERSDIRNIELEADIVAREIKQLVESGEASYRDCAVLLRSLAG